MSYWKIALGAIFLGPRFNSTSLEKINGNRERWSSKRKRAQKSYETYL